MKTTIKDVAKACGVSPSTVSRALHSSPRISEKVRAHITEMAQEMNFHPNQMASSLVNRKSRVVGIVFPGNAGDSLGHPFYPAVLQGLGHVAGERRYHMLLSTGGEAVSSAEAIRQMEDSGYASGLIVLAAQDSPEARVNLPVVVIGHPNHANGHDSVDTDNVKAGYTATRYLLERGHRRILLLGHDPQFTVTLDRKRGYEQALLEAGIALRDDWVVPGCFIRNTTDNVLLGALFSTEERPSAVVSMDDALSIGLTGLIADLGLLVPRDVSIVSFNNTNAGRYHNPALTSFDVDPYSLGASAMTLMLDRIEGKLGAPVAREVPFSLIERDSVAVYDR
ncbi:MAG: LacI family DNA-binding transcriptional regulator [Clostridia bacterium]